MSDWYRKRDAEDGKTYPAWQFTDVDAPKPGWLIQAIADNLACLRFGIPTEPPRIELYVDTHGRGEPGKPYSFATLGDWLVLYATGYVLACDDDAFKRSYEPVEAEQPQAIRPHPARIA